MKDIHNLELINFIQKDPLKTIGQRSYKLFDAYLMPFKFYTEFNIPKEHLQELESLPSIREEIEKNYKIDLGTRSWVSPLKYDCEDDRHLFQKAVDYILDYENKYPNPKNINYKLKLKDSMPNLDIGESLGHIGFRPQMYFGVSELACLRAYIDGYFLFKETFQLEVSSFENKLLKFITEHKIKDNQGFKTWDRNYRVKWDFAVFGTNEKHAIPRFLKDLEEYTQEKFKLKINDQIVQVDWSDYQSWNKSAHDLVEENKA